MLVAEVVAMSTLIAGCTVGESADGAISVQDVAARYGYDEASAALSPVFALVPQYKDPKDGYARDLLAAKCLVGVVEYRVVAPGSQVGLIDERTGQLVFDEQVAAEWGYPQLRLPASADSAVPDTVHVTPQMQEAMRACGQEADERLGKPPQRLLGGIEDSGWAAVPQDPGVLAAIEAWRTCMAPAGVIDLPDDPHEMPSASVVTQGSQATDTQGNVVGAAGSVPLSDRERDVAVLDAQCRDLSGYNNAEFHARVQAELRAIGRDVDGFEASRAAYETYGEKLDEVITELG